MKKMQLSVTPYMNHFDEQLPCEPGEKPEFYRIRNELEPQLGGFSPTWVADFADKEEAELFAKWRTTLQEI